MSDANRREFLKATAAAAATGTGLLAAPAKRSATVVHDWIATTGGACQGAARPWTPAGVAAAPTRPDSDLAWRVQ